MNKKALNVLEYNKIIQMLKNEAGSEMAKTIISELKPYTDVHTIIEELRSTTEAVDLIVRKGPLPIGGIYDIEDSLHFCRKGGTLSMKQLLQIHYNLNITKRVVSFLKTDIPKLPIIMSMAELMITLPRLEENIDRCILSEDEVSDNASSELKNIRRIIARQNKSIKNRIKQIIN
ncbi:MAG: endonuclease MutS2, partial [Eubacteriales bacterium]|nr:endonuclease MutS2 [Eubacteriales bacterium]